KHINEAPLPPSQTRPELGSNGPIDRVIMKGLEKDREKRYQSAVEFANDLEAAYARLKSGGVRSAMYPGSGSTRPFSSLRPAQRPAGTAGGTGQASLCRNRTSQGIARDRTARG